MTNDSAQFDKMTKTPIAKLVTSLAVPTVISMLVTSVYNMADTYFVSKLGTSATGAVGIVFSLMAVIQAIGFTIGMGSGSIIARALGNRDNQRADKTASSALFIGLSIGIIFAVFASFFIKPVMLLFGSTKTILPYAVEYGRFIIYGAPVMIGAFILNNVLRSQGKAKYAMFGIASGGVLNVILDPIFIFTFKLGTKGAAIATLLSQCISFSILIYCCLSGKSIARFRFSSISKALKDYWEIIKMGLPSLSRQGLSCVATMLLNRNAAVYGDAAVAAMSVVGKVFMTMFAVMLGIGQGFQPVVGFNYGAKEYKRVKKACYFTLILGTAVMAAMGTPVFIFSQKVMMLFTKGDMEVIKIGQLALKAQCIALPLVAVGTVSNMTYQMAGKSWTATLLSCARQGIFFLPLILFLPMKFGLFGVQIAQPVADVFTAVFSLPFGIKFIRELEKG